MHITIITCGGTIDKDYASSAGTYNFTMGEPAIQRVLAELNLAITFDLVSVLRKDSLDMDDGDRQLVLDAVKNVPDDRIIVTHGTDTMVKTAEVLNAVAEKTIILVGSSKPERFRDSDAVFNIGVAIGAVQTLATGVHITMNGRVYRWDEVRKDGPTGKFVKK
jgi:L-asparaginase